VKIPILTYHSTDIAGTQYAESDLVTFASDLETITAMDFEIIALSRLVDLWLRAPDALKGRRLVALTCDDGSDFDYHDRPHPVAGPQRSMLNALRDFRDRNPGAQPGLKLSSFVIVSPEARAILDQTCLIGQQWWNDDWWTAAVSTGLMEIASHSWDHNHETLPPGRFPHHARGTFASIADSEAADYQIAGAQAHLRRVVPNPGLTLFAYPYGEASRFLIEDYFPRKGEQIGVRAAFGDQPDYLRVDSHRWNMPRFVFRRDWRAPAELGRILTEATVGQPVTI
jgi:peptidoglycan/xylan/chitin deacetylase (PgdA/CDA1 family)